MRRKHINSKGNQIDISLFRVYTRTFVLLQLHLPVVIVGKFVRRGLPFITFLLFRYNISCVLYEYNFRGMVTPSNFEDLLPNKFSQYSNSNLESHEKKYRRSIFYASNSHSLMSLSLYIS